jgi:NhaP-type Na+/H+ or K+/H+ antiporter
VTVVAVFLALLFGYSLVSGWLERTPITAPILFTLAGMGTLLVRPELADRLRDPEILLRLAEAGLVLLLFTDASRTDPKVLRRIRSLPVRLLTVGMLLTLILGAVGARMVFPALSIWEAGVLAAILAPTDAGLGQIVVTSQKVPMRIRQALNVEAGLNDGLSVPFLLFFIALEGTRSGSAHLWEFIVQQLLFGVGIGLGIGLAGGWLLGAAGRRGLVLPAFRQIALVVLPLGCALASEASGASMFIAAFVCGLAVQAGFPEAGKDSVELTEQWGQLFNLFVFFFFGVIAARAWPDLTGRMLVYAVASLTAIRMLPVALALVGAGLSGATVLFMGWFGPRGLASIVLALVYVEGSPHLSGEATVRLTVVATVLLSILAHGLSAKPGIDAYAARLAGLGERAPEREAPGPAIR